MSNESQSRNDESRPLTEGEKAAQRLEANWLLIGEFFAERNWPDTKLGRAASDLNADMPRILRLLRARHLGPYRTGEPESDDEGVTVCDASGAAMTADEIVSALNGTVSEKLPSWVEEELKDGDRICEAAGVQRTEGGRLPVAKIVNVIRGRCTCGMAPQGQCCCGSAPK